MNLCSFFIALTKIPKRHFRGRQNFFELTVHKFLDWAASLVWWRLVRAEDLAYAEPKAGERHLR